MTTEAGDFPTSGLDSNVAGLLAYLLGWVSGLVFLLLDKRPVVRFHAAQSIGMCIGAVVVFIAFWILTIILTIITGILGFPIGILTALLFPLVGLGVFAMFIFCMYKAYNNEKYKVPVVGNIVEKMVGA
jgi:uncharacterized membrane protein